MSRVCLIASDKPLPLCDHQEERTSVTKVNGRPFTISFLRGFRVAEHRYYRHAVDILGHPIKPFQYEVTMEIHDRDLAHFRAYLSQNFRPGETVELWNLWVGVDQSGSLPHYRGVLADFDMETLKQFLEPGLEAGGPGQCRITITI